jgi:hypothetical protein
MAIGLTIKPGGSGVLHVGGEGRHNSLLLLLEIRRSKSEPFGTRSIRLIRVERRTDNG